MTSRLQKLMYMGVGAASLGFASAASAVDYSDFDQTDFEENSNLGNAEIDDVAIDIINIALGFVALVAVAVLIYGGFLMITSAGNEEQTEKGKKLVISAVIGLFMIFVSWGLTVWVINNLINATN